MSEQTYDPNQDFNEPEPVIDRSVASVGEAESLPAPTAGGIPLDQREITPFMPRDTNDLKALVRVIVKGGVVPESYLMKNPQPGPGRPEKVPDMSKMAVAILAGREHKKGPMWSLQYIMIVRGMPTVWGKGMKGLVLEKNVVTDYRLTWIDVTTLCVIGNDAEAVRAKMAEGYIVLWADQFQVHMAKPMPIPTNEVQRWPNELCAYLMVRRKGVDAPFVGRFSVGDAKRAGLWGNIKKKPWIQYPQDMLEHKAAARVWDRGFSDCITGLHIRELVEEMDEPPQIAAPASSAYLGGPTIDNTPQGSQYDKEADSMLAGLEKIVKIESLERWMEAAQSQLEWLTPHVPDKVQAIKDAYAAKLEKLKGTDASSSKTPEAGQES